MADQKPSFLKKMKRVAPFEQGGKWYRTFKQWSDDGYRVRKGSKALLRDDMGQPCFSEDQVTEDNIGGVEDYDPAHDWY